MLNTRGSGHRARLSHYYQSPAVEWKKYKSIRHVYSLCSFNHLLESSGTHQVKPALVFAKEFIRALFYNKIVERLCLRRGCHGKINRRR